MITRVVPKKEEFSRTYESYFTLFSIHMSVRSAKETLVFVRYV